ncbi:MAG: tyrosine--tRNA ligase [Patescibacteria group bacterium]|nr:tyrosine--tRNA ligase [Patescibacteria group bacterium]
MDLTDKILNKNIAEIIDKNSLKDKLESGKTLRIKLGVDPTRPDLHLGHAVTLWKLKEFQDAGHKVIFLIGDYTAMIGDPSGRNTSRPVLSLEEIKENAETYVNQAQKILDLDKCELRYNSEWLEKLSFADIIDLLGKTTVAQITEREDFAKRLKDGNEIGLHELLYPVMQGYDSIQLKADIEIGGMDQKLNMLMGRQLQKKMDDPEQDIIMMPLLVGTDGSKKMSKSLDNYIGIDEKAEDQFGKIMSIADNMIMDYWKLCVPMEDEELQTIEDKLNSSDNPMEIKYDLAKTIVSLYHDESAAKSAKDNFVKTFSKRELPDNIPEIRIDANKINIIDLLIETKLVDSKSEAKRMVEQKGVKIDQNLIEDLEQNIKIQPGMVVQVGKRKFIKISD